MVTIFNKSNRPIGIEKMSVLPDKELKIKDKIAYCEVFDENGNPTGKKQLLPGLVALQNIGFITIKEEPDDKPKEEKKVEENAETEKPKAKRGRKPKEEAKAE